TPKLYFVAHPDDKPQNHPLRGWRASCSVARYGLVATPPTPASDASACTAILRWQYPKRNSACFSRAAFGLARHSRATVVSASPPRRGEREMIIRTGRRRFLQTVAASAAATSA